MLILTITAHEQWGTDSQQVLADSKVVKVQKSNPVLGKYFLLHKFQLNKEKVEDQSEEEDKLRMIGRG